VTKEQNATEYEHKSCRAMELGNKAKEKGDIAKSERHFDRAQTHLDKANILRGLA
jgi:hypothetical protein